MPADTEPELELPDLEQGELDEATLRALAGDIRDHAELIEVRVKGAARSRGQETSLDQGVRDLVQGRVRGLQLVYHFDGQTWMDTVLQAPGGFRVVRMPAPHLSP